MNMNMNMNTQKMKETMLTKKEFDVLFVRLLNVIKNEYSREPYSGLIIAVMDFKMPILIGEIIIVLAVMRLVIKYAYTTKSDYGKFTISLSMIIPSGEVSFTIGKAITFRVNETNLPVYALIDRLIRKTSDEYEKSLIKSLYIRIYLSEMKSSTTQCISDNELESMLWESINSNVMVEPIEPKTIGRCNKHRYPKHITALPPMSKKRKPFIVADTETVIINNVHVPYATGFLVVRPGDNLHYDAGMDTYYSEDYPEYIFKTFEDRSNKMMFDFIERLAFVVRKNPSTNTVYYHNFARFDGIILLKHMAIHHGTKYTIRPLMRNHMLYELTVYLGNKLLFRLRDSLTLLPGSLNDLASNLCPELGSKGSIQHDKVQMSNLMNMRTQLLEYMKQDIRLLAGVMLKAQEIYWTQFNVDIVTKLTLSTLAITIFRIHYYDPISWPIHIPNRNQDTFIRRGYYGGHADAYIPYGENLYYYDVNSLYPYIMKSYPMPGGEPVWRGDLENEDLDNLFGFIEAYVVCPQTIKRPFLPYRNEKDQTLLFPTGHFVGVYYSEELKYARDMGYRVIPLSGYLFEKMPSPFDGFVSSLFEKRQEANRTGNKAMSFVYKILMNSLYGRFGINPKSTITEVCDLERYEYLIKKTDLIYGNKLSDNYYIISYLRNTDKVPDTEWSPPRISAVQLSAAITACARIHMYPYISRDDCYYTDTDSAVLRSPLPEEEVTSTVLGKMKLEHYVKKGIFLAPKSYYIRSQAGEKIIKHKGLAKSKVDDEWFESQYADISRTTQTTVESNFLIDWEKLDITKKETILNLGIRIGYKRELVFDNDIWVDTVPLDVTYYAGQEARILRYEVKRLQEDNKINIELKDRLISDLEYKIAILTEERDNLSKQKSQKDQVGQSHSAHQADNPKKPPD